MGPDTGEDSVRTRGEASGAADPANTLISDFQSPELGESEFLLSQLLLCGALLRLPCYSPGAQSVGWVGSNAHCGDHPIPQPGLFGRAPAHLGCGGWRCAEPRGRWE